MSAKRWADVWLQARAALAPEADRQCKDTSRQHYLPSRPPGVPADAAGRCRVRVYAATEASGGLPVVLLTELPANIGPSVTNAGRADRRRGPEPPPARAGWRRAPALLVERHPNTGYRRDELAPSTLTRRAAARTGLHVRLSDRRPSRIALRGCQAQAAQNTP